jgi:hypothetical protein
MLQTIQEWVSKAIDSTKNSKVMCELGQLEQTMGKSFYLGSRLRQYAYSNQFGAESEGLKSAILELMLKSDSVIGSNMKGSMASDVFELLDSIDQPDDNNNDEGKDQKCHWDSTLILTPR